MPRHESQSSEVSAALSQLRSPADAARSISIDERVQLCLESIEGVARVARDWAEEGSAAKGARGNSVIMAEELLSGPAVVARQLQLTIQTLLSLRNGGHPRLPGPLKVSSDGRLSVPVFPTTGYFDSLTFMGLRARIRMQPGVAADQIHGKLVEQAREGKVNGISAVLGAGNVSSIPATDSLNRIMFEGRAVALKINPVNQHLAPFFDQAFASLVKAGLLKILTGGTDIGQALIHHESVTDVHVTGSLNTHHSIVWGGDPAEQNRRRDANDPLLRKPVTSELGNVTPWIIVPGRYSEAQLRSQAQHVAASITNNASFNCLATKVIVTWEKWEQREQFLELLNHFLSATPLRPAYYPGAADRFRRFTGTDVSVDDQQCLPWTVLRGQSFDERPELFTEESFVCVCAETSVPGDTPEKFLHHATDFVNAQMTGSLCASVTLPGRFRREQPQVAERCLNDLRYGSVCVNQWSGLAYGLTSPPWGAYPGATVRDVDSGIGAVHNTYLLDQFEKTILEGPLISFPKPIWFPSHGNALQVAEKLLSLYQRPGMMRLPPLFAAALRG